MRLWIDAACGCHMGKIRKNNEDNFSFWGQCLEQDNQGLSDPAVFSGPLKSGLGLAVFDGMGGEAYGEVAAAAAASRMQSVTRSFPEGLLSQRKYLEKCTAQLNQAVVEAKQSLEADRCGATMVMLYFAAGAAYSCNVGDSRSYRLRGGTLQQLSEDHTEKRPEGHRKKAPLTQYLGIEPETMLLAPYITKDKVQQGDMYLLCSDGLTDMLTNSEITDIMLKFPDPEECVGQLIDQALERGGRDNVTVIVCKIV